MSNDANPTSPQSPKPDASQPQTPPPAGDDLAEYRKVETEYNADQLEHLSDLEHVRQRPSMYIADTAARGLHHLVYEVVDNSIDEAMAGYAGEISVRINNDGSVIIEDDGRGIPVEEHPDLGCSTLQGVMTVLKFGGKFHKGAYQTSGGLHGVGVTVVNFLSEWCEVEVRRDGHVYQQEYERGVPTAEVARIGTTDRMGTKTTFKPDPQIFPVTQFNYGILYRRLQELAFFVHPVIPVQHGNGEVDAGLPRLIFTFYAPVQGHDRGHLFASSGQSRGQRSGHVREPAGLSQRSHFRDRHQDIHVCPLYRFITKL